MAQRDEGGLAALYDRWSDSVHGVIFSIVRDLDDAEELVEETFWQAWRQASRWDASRGSVGTWLRLIARTRALDRIRSVRRRSESPLEQTDVDRHGTEIESPLDSASERERSDSVLLALEDLPADQKEAVLLAYFGGLSHSEIAARLGQPLGTIKTRVRLAFVKLRQSLAPLRDDRL